MTPLAEFLAAHTTVSLATTGPRGPAAASLFYVPRRGGRRLLFISDPDTLHGRNLAAEPQCAATVHTDHQDWRELRGVQLRGTAAAAPRRDWPHYLARYPEAATVPELVAALRDVTLYRFEVAWARLIDNSRAFGYRREWDFAAPPSIP